MTIKSDYSNSQGPSTQRPPQPVQIKYQQLFSDRRLTPADRVNSNTLFIERLNVQISSGLVASYFFKCGSPQKETDHFREVFNGFFVGVHGGGSLVKKSSKSLVSEFGRYADVARIEREANFPTESLLEELKEIVQSTRGLKKQLLTLLQSKKYTIDAEWELETRDTWFREFIGVASSFPRCIESLADIVSKLLQIEWLNDDIHGIQVYTGQKQKISKSISLNSFDIVLKVVPFGGVDYFRRKTDGDGSCSLHALLGEETPSRGYSCERAREKLLTKIRENIRNGEVKNALIGILKEHANAQNDASSAMLFEGATGQRLKREYLSRERRYELEITPLKEAESALWMQEVNSLRGLILEKVDLNHERYREKSDDEIFDIVKGNWTYFETIIYNNDDAFLNAVSEDKQRAITAARVEIHVRRNREDLNKEDFLLHQLCPHYLEVIRQDSFYLNTPELALAAQLFNKNIHVIDREGGSVTIVATPGLQEEPIIICHEGVHFERCTPITEEEKPQLQAIKEWEDLQSLAEQALLRDGQLNTLHSIENRKEAYRLLAAGFLGWWLGPAPFVIQSARSGINIGGRQVDPENKNKEVQVAKLLANSAAAKFISGVPGCIGALGIDLVDLLSSPERHNQANASIRNLITTFLKGVASRDPKKFVEYFTSGLLGETFNRLPENTEQTYHVAGFLKALAQSPELHGAFAKHIVDEATKPPPKPKVGGILTPEEQEMYPKQVLSEIDEPTVEERPVIIEIDDADPIQTLPPEPVVNPEIDKESRPKLQITIEEESNPIAPKSESELPPIEMHDPEGYRRLLREEHGLAFNLEIANDRLVDPNYSKFGTPQDTLIQEQAGVVEADKNLKIKEAKNGDTWGPKQARKAERKLSKAEDNWRGAVRKRDEVNNYISQWENTIADLTKNLEANRLAQAKASSPKHIPVPEISIRKVVDQKTDKNHHLHGFDLSGNSVSLGKYPEAEDARFISGMFTKVDTEQASLDRKCYNAQREAEDAGIAIDDIPTRPTFGMPTILGNDVDVNYKTLQTTSIDDQRKAKSFIKSIQDLIGRPVEAQGFSKAEINEILQQTTPNIKEIPQDILWDKTVKSPAKAYNEVNDFLHKIGASTAGSPNGAVNIGTISSPEMNRARGEPTLFHHDLKPEPTRTQPSSPYWETRHQIAMEGSGAQVSGSKSDNPIQASQTANTNAPVQEPSIVQNWGWQGVEAMQQDTVMKTLEQNINANRQTFSGMPQAPIDYQSVWGPGVASNVQTPPTDFSGLGRNEELSLGSTNQRQIQTAGFAPAKGSEASAKVLQGVVSLFLPDMSDMPGAENPMDHINRIITAESVNNFVKSVPKGTANIFIAGACLMLPDMSDIPGSEDPRTHLKMVSKNAFLKYDDIMQIDPNAFSSRAGVALGEMIAFGGAGKVIKVADGVSILGMACEGGMAGLVMAEAHDTNKVAGIAFGFAGGAVFGAVFSSTKPEIKALIDKLQGKPQGFGQQVRAIEALQPAYRSGLVSEGTVARLSERNIAKIRTDWVFPKKGGATINGRWYTEHALERMAPRTPEVMAELEVRALARARKEGCLPQTEKFGEWWIDNHPDPRGIPPSVIEAEIANPGSTSVCVSINKQGGVITVIPRGSSR